jgi:hypothetical protein
VRVAGVEQARGLRGVAQDAQRVHRIRRDGEPVRACARRDGVRLAHRAAQPGDLRLQRVAAGRLAAPQLVHEPVGPHRDAVVAAATDASRDGFSVDDVAWLLRNAPGEVLVLRPAPSTAPAPHAERDPSPASMPPDASMIAARGGASRQPAPAV